MGVRKEGQNGHLHPLEIETKDDNFLEKLKLAAQFRSIDLISCNGNLCTSMTLTLHAWASEGFVPGRASRGLSQNFLQGEAKIGEICFSPLEIEKNNLFLLIVLNSNGASSPCTPLPTPMSACKPSSLFWCYALL